MKANQQTEDQELSVLSEAVAIIKKAPPEARFRIVEYLNERFIEGLGKPAVIPPAAKRVLEICRP